MSGAAVRRGERAAHALSTAVLVTPKTARALAEVCEVAYERDRLFSEVVHLRASMLVVGATLHRHARENDAAVDAIVAAVAESAR